MRSSLASVVLRTWCKCMWCAPMRSWVIFSLAHLRYRMLTFQSTKHREKCRTNSGLDTRCWLPLLQYGVEVGSVANLGFQVELEFDVLQSLNPSVRLNFLSRVSWYSSYPSTTAVNVFVAGLSNECWPEIGFWQCSDVICIVFASKSLLIIGRPLSDWRGLREANLACDDSIVSTFRLVR